MQRTLLLLALAMFRICGASAQQSGSTFYTRPLKQHVYSIQRCNQNLKPHLRVDYSVMKRFKTLCITNYSVVQLFSLAMGEGDSFLSRHVLIESADKERLLSTYCYQLTLEDRDSEYLYKIMLSSLCDRFPQYRVALKHQGGEKLLVIKDAYKGKVK